MCHRCQTGMDHPPQPAQYVTMQRKQQSLHQSGPASVSTEVTHVVKGYLGPEEEKHSLTHMQSCIPADSQWKQTGFPFPLPVPVYPRVPARIPPPLQHMLRTRRSLF